MSIRAEKPKTPQKPWVRWAVAAVLAAVLVALPAAWGAFSGQSADTGNKMTAAALFPDYPTSVLADGPLFYHRLEEAPGTAIAADSSGNGRSGIYSTEGGGSLSGLWPMDEGAGTTAADVSDMPATHDLTLSAATWSGTAVSGSALSFNGTTAYAANASAAVATTAGFTVAAWVYLTDTSVSRTAVSQDGTAASGFELGYDAGLNRWVFGMAESDSAAAVVDKAFSDSAPQTGTWTYLVGVYNSASTGMDFYVNGEHQAAVGLHTAAHAWNATGGFTVGAGKVTARTHYFEGLVDEVRIENGLVFSPTPANLALAFAAGPVTSWQFDENAGSTVVDSSGAQHDGTLAGAAGWTAARSGAAAVSLDGNTAYVSGTGTVSSAADFTVTAWVELANGGGNGALVSENGSHSSGFALRYGGGRWRFVMARTDTNGAATDTAVSTTHTVVGSWVHLAGVWDAGTATMTLYVDGVAEDTAAHPTTVDAATGLQVGRDLFNNTWTYHTVGSIDDVRVYAWALNPGQVAAVYNGGTSATTLGTAGALQGAQQGLQASTGQAFALGGRSSGYNLTRFTDPTTYSLECWFRTRGVSSTGRGQTLFSFSSAATGNTAAPDHDRRLFLDVSGYLVVGTASGTANVAKSAATYADGLWHHVVATVDPVAGLDLYADGVLVGTAAYTAPANFSGYWRWGGDTWDAAWPADYYWLGSMDEVAVYGTVLSAQRIANHYHANH